MSKRTDVIRSESEINSRQMAVRDELQALLSGGRTKADLAKVRALKRELGELDDELAIARNLEAERIRQENIRHAQEREAELWDLYHQRIELLQVVVPWLRNVEGAVNEIVRLVRKSIGQTQAGGHGDYPIKLPPGIPLSSILREGEYRSFLAKLEGLLPEEKLRVYSSQDGEMHLTADELRTYCARQAREIKEQSG